MKNEDDFIRNEYLISKALFHGVLPEKVAAHFNIPLATVEKVIEINKRTRKASEDFDAWVEANKEPG